MILTQIKALVNLNEQYSLFSIKNKINLLTNPNTWTQTWIKFRSDGACISKLRKFAPSILY